MEKHIKKVIDEFLDYYNSFMFLFNKLKEKKYRIKALRCLVYIKRILEGRAVVFNIKF